MLSNMCYTNEEPSKSVIITWNLSFWAGIGAPNVVMKPFAGWISYLKSRLGGEKWDIEVYRIRYIMYIGYLAILAPCRYSGMG